MARRQLRIASVPSSHVYVRHLAALDADHDPVERLPDPSRRSGVEQGWWPPAMLDPVWIDRHADAFDVFHVHFGFDAVSPDELANVVSTLRRHRKPLVYTVHDLRNPHQPERATHDALLDVLVPAADALITLTRGASVEIARRWGRAATVLAHPHVVPLETMAAWAETKPAAGHDPSTFRVGLHVKSLRACMDPHRLLPVLVDVVGEVPGGVLQVDGHHDVLTRGGARYDADLAAMLERMPAHVDVRVHDYFSDDALFSYLSGLDLSVLPYRFGTHSGWLEACRDLGTAVAAPTCGYYADQGPVHSYTLDERRFDADRLRRAVLAAAHGAPAPRITAAQRSAQRTMVASAHARLYAEVVDRAADVEGTLSA